MADGGYRAPEYAYGGSSEVAAVGGYAGYSSQVNDFALKEVARASNGLSLWLPKDVYLPGEEIIGKVKGDFSQRLTFRAVRVSLHGEVYVHWHTGAGKNRRDHRKTVELFPEQILTLQGLEKGASGKDGHLEKGQHYEWDFRLTLPPRLPGSVDLWEGTHIKYTLTSYIDIPLWPDYTVSLYVSVQPAPDSVEVPPDALQPVNKRDIAVVNACCCLGNQGDAIISLAAKQRVLWVTEGQTLDLPSVLELVAGVENNSKRALSKIHFAISGEVWMTTGSRTHTIHFNVGDQDFAPSLQPNTSVPTGRIALPSLQYERASTIDTARNFVFQQPTIDAGGILKIRYYLSLVAENGCGSNPESHVELVVLPNYGKNMQTDAPLPYAPQPTAAFAPPYPTQALTEAYQVAPVYSSYGYGQSPAI